MLKQLYDMGVGPSSNTTDFSRSITPKANGLLLQVTDLSMSDSGTTTITPNEVSEWERSLEQTLDEKAEAWKKLADM